MRNIAIENLILGRNAGWREVYVIFMEFRKAIDAGSAAGYRKKNYGHMKSKEGYLHGSEPS